MEEDLLCHEKWSAVMSPLGNVDGKAGGSCESRDADVSEEEFDHAVKICLEKEVGYMPGPGYAEMVREKDLVFARVRVMHWFIKSRSRLRLAHETIFLAANCFDRFISIFRSQEWEYWMLELLAISCLSVSAKFTEAVIVPSLHEIQMEDLDHSFEHSAIQKIELTLLQTLGWRLSATTAYSYAEFLEFEPTFLCNNRVHTLLLRPLLDIELIKFRPSVIAAAAISLSCAITDGESSDASLPKLIGKIIPNEDQMGEVLECQRQMQRSSSNLGCLDYYAPSSPVTVLGASRIDVKGTMADHYLSY
ncbi:hypothetical protein MLD38_029862 [Melastoma candidum]|uniref:Uncharacterized protein n=1 Tax=Melastoma candidum TaxID=119954 RepID=A0ACB9N548_9MYRT|nr:hypothetical protein MLD38_029862 [Melastoma candidum]